MKNVNDKINFILNKKSRNRIVMPPMDTLMSDNGFANDFHIQHYGARAYGGVGTIIVESTAVSPEGRIREKDLGLWMDEHIFLMSKVVDIAHQANAIIGVQLNHAGAKSETKENKYAPGISYFQYLDQSKTIIVEEKELKMIEDQFIQAAFRAKKSGFDFIEIHAAHGYFLNAILHPQLNEDLTKTDVLSRAQYLLNIILRIKNEVQIPIGIRMSFVDHDPNGVDVSYYLPLIEKLNDLVDYYNVSSGETISRTRIVDLMTSGEKLYRVPIVNELKKYTTKPLIVAGNLTTLSDANKMLENGADGLAFGRELLYNPNLPILSILDVNKMSKEDYHWNNNLWYNHIDYKTLKIKLGLEFDN